MERASSAATEKRAARRSASPQRSLPYATLRLEYSGLSRIASRAFIALGSEVKLTNEQPLSRRLLTSSMLATTGQASEARARLTKANDDPDSLSVLAKVTPEPLL